MSKYKNKNNGKPRKVLTKIELLDMWKRRAKS